MCIYFKCATAFPFYLVNQFNNNQLQYVTKGLHLVNTGTQIIQSSILHKQKRNYFYIIQSLLI